MDWLVDQIREIARIPASDDDGDRITGLFLASHKADGTVEWQVREGQLFISSGAFIWQPPARRTCLTPATGTPDDG